MYDIFVQAIRHARMGRWQESVDLCKKILDSQPTNSDALMLLSRLAERTGQIELAIDLAKQGALYSTGCPTLVGYYRDLLGRIGRNRCVDILRSVDFKSFFERNGCELEQIDYSWAPRIYTADIDSLNNMYLASVIYEEESFDRGIFIARGTDLEVFYSNKVHANIISKNEFLLERQHELPCFGEKRGFGDNVCNIFGFGSYSSYFPSMTSVFRREGLETYEIKEEAVYIGGSHNYGHFLMDYLPKLFSLERKGLLELPVYTFDQTLFHNEVIEALFPDFRFIDLSKISSDNCIFRFREAYIPSYVMANVSIGLLRNKVSGLLEDAGHGRQEFLYLYRGDLLSRVQNELEVIEFLKARGFYILNTMEYSFMELVQHFSSAKMVVSSIGAQLTTAIFCQPGTVVIELCPSKYLESATWFFNNRNYVYGELDHRVVVGQTVEATAQDGIYNWIGKFPIEAIAHQIQR